MTTGDPGMYLLFAASEPDLGEGLVNPVPMYARVFSFGANVPLPPDLGALRGPDGSAPRYFPGEQGRSIRLAFEVAATHHRTIRLVDLNRPGWDGDLIARYTSDATVLPLLVAPSGGRLEGTREFVPSRLSALLRA